MCGHLSLVGSVRIYSAGYSDTARTAVRTRVRTEPTRDRWPHMYARWSSSGEHKSYALIFLNAQGSPPFLADWELLHPSLLIRDQHGSIDYIYLIIYFIYF